MIIQPFIGPHDPMKKEPIKEIAKPEQEPAKVLSFSYAYFAPFLPSII